jgi:hypothetical protein
MDKNLPPNNNQQPDDLNINPPVPPVSSPDELEKTPAPEKPEIPETPPTITPAEPEIKKEETKPLTEEKPIEIGSLGEEPSFTSYAQETSNDSSNNSQKVKKIKTISSVLGFLLIIIALPLTVILVKQRQEIRKEATETSKSESTSFCGITVSPGSHGEQNGVYTFNYSITGSGHTVKVQERGCVCNDGFLKTCGPSSGSCSTNSYIKTTPINGTITVRQPAGDCGTFQADVFIISVDDKSECHN